MAVVNGTLIDIGFQAMWPIGGRLKFTLSDPAVTIGNQIISAKPRYCIPAANGDWTMPLMANDQMTEPRYYRLQIEALDADFYGDDAGLAWREFPEWRIYVPEGIHDFSSLVLTGGNPQLVWVEPDPPSATPAPNALWLDTTTGMLNGWSN